MLKLQKLMVTVKHLTTQEVEEAEFDIEEIERELSEKKTLHLYKQMDSYRRYQERLCHR